MPAYLAFQLWNVASEIPCLRQKTQHFCAGLGFLQNRNDLLFAQPLPLHVRRSLQVADATSQPYYVRGACHAACS